MWKKYNPNPADARVGDCVVRALSKALNQSWEDTYIDLASEGLRKYDMPSANHVWNGYLISRGFKKHLLPDTCPDCMTVEKFSREFDKGVYVLALQGHTVCVVDGNYYDTWDSGKEIPLYYFRKKEYV